MHRDRLPCFAVCRTKLSALRFCATTRDGRRVARSRPASLPYRSHPASHAASPIAPWDPQHTCHPHPSFSPAPAPWLSWLHSVQCAAVLLACRPRSRVHARRVSRAYPRRSVLEPQGERTVSIPHRSLSLPCATLHRPGPPSTVVCPIAAPVCRFLMRTPHPRPSLLPPTPLFLDGHPAKASAAGNDVPPPASHWTKAVVTP